LGSVDAVAEGRFRSARLGQGPGACALPPRGAVEENQFTVGLTMGERGTVVGVRNPSTSASGEGTFKRVP